MATKNKLERKSLGVKMAHDLMAYIDGFGFDEVYKEIKRNEDYHVYIREMLGCIPTRRIIDDLDERGELGMAYQEYVDNYGVSLVKDTIRAMSQQEKVEMVSQLFGIPYLASAEEYGEAVKKAVEEQYYRK